MAGADIYHPDFKAMPYWWEAYTPTANDPLDVPARARVVIVGGGYAGLSTALEAAKHDVDCVVLEVAELGFGASTRNGGGVSGGVNIGKSFSGKSLDPASEAGGSGGWRRCVRVDRAPDRRGGHQLPLAEDRSFCRGLDAGAFHRPGGEDRVAERCRTF